MTENIYQIQNSIVLRIPSDIQLITDGVRESFSFLAGLTSIDFIYSGVKPERKSVIEEGFKKFKEELDTLENSLYFNNVQNSLVSFPEEDKLKKLIVDYIKLKESIDEFQLEVINELIGVSYESLKIIAQNKKYLEQYLGHIYSAHLIKSAFLQSHAENKNVTYFLLIESQETFDRYKNPFNTYTHVSVHDYSYSLQRGRIKLEYVYEQLMKLIFSLQEIDNKRTLDELVHKQYLMNKHIVALTYIIVFMTIVSIGLGIIQFYR